MTSMIIMLILILCKDLWIIQVVHQGTLNPTLIGKIEPFFNIFLLVKKEVRDKMKKEAITLDKAIQICANYPMFKHVRHGELHLFSYNYVIPDVYKKEPLAKELRGIIFNEDGTIIARPFAKFFNYGEPLCEVSTDSIITTNDKIDGSMAIPYMLNNEIKVSSRGSFTSETAMKAYDMLKNNDNIRSLVKNLLCDEYTPILEIVDPADPIVIAYKQKELFFVGARNIKSGKVMSPEEIAEIGSYYKVKTPNVIHRNVALADVIKYIGQESEVLKEGVVGYTDDGLMVKVKYERYLKVHRVASNLNEKRIAKAFFEKTIDDIIPFLSEDSKKVVEKVISKINRKIERKLNEIEEFMQKEYSSVDDLKAEMRANNVRKEDRWLYTRVWYIKHEEKDGERVRDAVRDAVFNYFKKRYKR